MVGHILGELNPETFLAEYWQQKPLLIRQALHDFHSDLSAEVLAGLSLEEDIRSRLVRQVESEPGWVCRHGPFTMDDYADLPETGWTLLVQDVEKHLPQYAALLEHFSFLPRWRIDDLMVSYAVDGGSVGPHTDNYDVFLLQASGQRQWQIQTRDVQADQLLDDIELKILREFEAQQEWLLEPGDMLYLPAGVAHHGVAAGDCITFSIGFRAPTQLELLQSLEEQLGRSGGGHQHYRDSLVSLQARRSELNPDIIDGFRTMLTDIINDEDALVRSCASLLTEPVETPGLYAAEDLTLETFTEQLHSAGKISLHPALRSVYYRHDSSLHWYIHGNQYVIDNSASEAVMQLVDNYCLDGPLLITLATSDCSVRILHELYLGGELKIVV